MDRHRRRPLIPITRMSTPSQDRIREGFRRLALVVGGVIGGPIFLVGLFFLFGEQSERAVGAMIVVSGLVTFAFLWGGVRLVGWIVSGFFSTRAGPD